MLSVKKSICCFLFIVAFCVTSYAHAARIVIMDGRFTDTERKRVIPYKLYAPEPINGPLPVVIFSHGLGGSTSAAPYFGEALAAHGYLVFFIQHPGTDKTIWEGLKKPAEIKRAMRRAIRNPQPAIDRFNDLHFVLDELMWMNEGSNYLRDKIDLARVGMAGHSFGARGVMMATGEKSPAGDFKDTRIRAAVALSPNLPESYIGEPEERFSGLYQNINIPLFHITGTEDDHPFRTGFDPQDRTLPYKHIQASHQFLLVLKGATHMTFGGRRENRFVEHQDRVADAVKLFFDAYLKRDTKALNELQNGFPTRISHDDRFEYK